MDALMLLKEHWEKNNEFPSILLSGEDRLVKKHITEKWFGMTSDGCMLPHIVVDMSRMKEACSMIQDCSLHISKTLPGENGLSVFNGNRFDTESRLRKMMHQGGWQEEKINKCITYLELICYIDRLRQNVAKENGINLRIIARYSASKEVERAINQLERDNILSHREAINLIARYSELASVAPEIENLLIATSASLAISSENSVRLDDLGENDVLYAHIGRVSDEFMRRMILDNLAGLIEDYAVEHGRKPFVSIWARGKSEDNILKKFIESVEEMAQLYLCTDNFFIIEDWSEIQPFFQLSVYAKHNALNACECIEQSFGEIRVRKTTYAVAEDMSKGVLDRILSRNIVRTKSWTEPRQEKRYRKEDIACFPAGYGIVNYNGQSAIVRIC